MVNLVEDWASLEHYSQYCRYGTYQVKDVVDGIEIRVVVGRFGYIKTFKDTKDQLLNRILAFCETGCYIKVQGSISDELFFT